MVKPELEAIKTRQREIQDKIASLQQEAEELLVALRVLRRFSPSDQEPESKLGPPRPEGTPTLFEMAEIVINRSGHGLKGSEIVDEIGKEFWPGVRGPQILPSIYGFAKRGRLKKAKTGHFFTVKKNEAPNGSTSGASGDEGSASSSFERDALRP